MLRSAGIIPFDKGLPRVRYVYRLAAGLAPPTLKDKRFGRGR